MPILVLLMLFDAFLVVLELFLELSTFSPPPIVYPSLDANISILCMGTKEVLMHGFVAYPYMIESMQEQTNLVVSQNLVLKQCGSRAFDGEAGALTYHTHIYDTSSRLQFVADRAIFPFIDAIPNKSACSLAIRNCISIDGMCFI